MLNNLFTFYKSPLVYNDFQKLDLVVHLLLVQLNLMAWIDKLLHSEASPSFDNSCQLSSNVSQSDLSDSI